MKRFRRHEINKDYFKELNNKNKFYTLGLLWADGFLQKVNSINLECKDKELVEFLKNEIGGNFYERLRIDPRFINNNISYRWFCGSQEIVSDLLKSNYRKNIKIPIEYQASFIKGFSDGDGCIYLNKKEGLYQYSLSGPKTQDWKFILDNIPIEFSNNLKLSINRSGSLLRVIGKKALPMLNWIYEEDTFCLERKYKKYIEFKEIFNAKCI